nr:uncharacterized protein LOC123750178 [Procambarus clarkii]
MGSESQGSTFWTNFYTIRKKNTTRESLWSRFHSPYDPIQRVESPVSSRFSGHRKAAELGDPVSPQSGRSRSLWSPKTWYPVQRVSRSALPSPRGTSAGSLKEERPAEIKLRTSRSAEILVDLCNGEENGCCRSGKRPPETSKSTDELVKVRNRWLEKLDQYKVSFSSSRSDDSLNLKLTKENWMRSCDQCGVMAIKSQPNLFSSLRRMRKIIRENPTPNPKKENFYISTDHSPRHEIVINKSPKPDQKCKDTSTKLDREKSADDGHRRCYRNESGEDGKVLLVSATPDHPALTVRPGYHLARSRSCPRSSSHSVSTCKEPSSPDSNSSIRSSGCSLGTSERTHEDRTQRSRSSKRSTTSESVVKDKESLVLEHTPRIPALKINKYNLKTCFARVDQRKTLSLCNHLPARNLEQVFAQEAERALNDNEMFALSTRKDPFESLNKTLSPRQRILRSTLKHRLRSEEKLALGHKSCLPQGQPPGRVFGNKTVLSPRASMVLGEDDSGLCSGVIFDGSTSARTGLFPASLVARRDTNDLPLLQLIILLKLPGKLIRTRLIRPPIKTRTDSEKQSESNEICRGQSRLN